MAALKERARRVWRAAKRIVDPPLHRAEIACDYEVLGSDHGGWPVVRGSLAPGALVCSFGVGMDVSFDLALMARYGCRVEAFDPTPRSRDWIAAQVLPEGFRFHAVGLSDRTETLVFSAPERADHVSYTVGARGAETGTVALPVRALSEIMADLGHGGRAIDFLKMDIEGSEYAALAQMMAAGTCPAQLCVEYHHGMYGYTREETRESVALLGRHGYRIFFVSPSGREYGFLRAG